MFCPNCGKQVLDTSRFCGKCGTKLTTEDLVVEQESTNAIPKVPETPSTQDQQELPVSVQPVRKAEPSPIPSAHPQPVTAPAVPRQKKKSTGKVLFLVVAAVVLVSLLGFAASKLLFAEPDPFYVYISDNQYCLLSDLELGASIEIPNGSVGSELETLHRDDLVRFSSDGKYVYFYTKVNYDDRTGTLCRAEYGKLRENSKKNEKYVDVIAKNVSLSLGFELHPDDLVTYVKNGNLYYYDGQESILIAKNASSYTICEDGRVLYCVRKNHDDVNGGISLYWTTLEGPENREMIASDISIFYSYHNPEHIIYYKRTDGFDSLYTVGIGQEERKLGDRADTQSGFHDGKFYFTAAGDTSLNLYDYVVDPYAAADAALVEPKESDFMVPHYAMDMVDGQELSESDLGTLYTSCTKPLYWYGMSRWSCSSMESALGKTWINDEGLKQATRSFIEKFSDRADENGYILVDDEVRSGLQEIQKYAVEPEKEWQWLWLCYYKYQDGEDIDYVAYNEAQAQWETAQKRIEIRQFLQNEENVYPLYTLYCYDNGEVTALRDNISGFSGYHAGTMYATADMITEKIDMDDLVSADNPYATFFALFDVDAAEENYILTDDGTLCQMSPDAAEALASASEEKRALLYYSGGKFYMSEDNGDLYEASVQDGIVDSFKLIAEDAEVEEIIDGTIYYRSNLYYSSDDVYYVDLYTYKDGETTLLASEVMRYNSALYEDGVILAYSDYQWGEGGELIMIDEDGETTIISDHASHFVRVNASTVLYCSDDDLYYYNGTESERIGHDVQWFWCQEEMRILLSI